MEQIWVYAWYPTIRRRDSCVPTRICLAINHTQDFPNSLSNSYTCNIGSCDVVILAKNGEQHVTELYGIRGKFVIMKVKQPLENIEKQQSHDMGLEPLLAFMYM